MIDFYHYCDSAALCVFSPLHSLFTLSQFILPFGAYIFSPPHSFCVFIVYAQQLIISSVPRTRKRGPFPVPHILEVLLWPFSGHSTLHEARTSKAKQTCSPRAYTLPLLDHSQ